MNKNALVIFLVENVKYFVQFFCVIFGVIAQESYQVLKKETYKFNKILFKLILAWFVCLISTPFIMEHEILKKYFPFVIMLLAFWHRPAGDFIMKDLFPMAASFIVKALTKTAKSNEDVK